MNRTNLELLAQGLLTLPDTYEHFDMGVFSDEANRPEEVRGNHCKTAACAIGHGPYFVAEAPLKGEEWHAYSERVFGINDKAWDWCFSDYWEETDNTPKGAAKRIFWLLEHGVPENGEKQMLGDAPLCYA